MEEPEPEPEAQPEDPAIAEYRASGDSDMGAAAKLSYQHELNIQKNPTTANEETNKQIRMYLGDGHALVPEFSGSDSLTIKRPNGDYILAVRGTRPTNISDLISDEQILLGANVNRSDKIEKVYLNLRRQNPNSKITLTGHSLGGYVAKDIADRYEFKDFKLDMVGFDVATSPIHVGMSIANAIAEPELIPEKVAVGVANRVSNYVKHALIGGSEYGRHRTYSTDTFDAISVMNNITNFDDEVKTLPQRVSRSYWLGSHSPNNFILEPKQTAIKTFIQKVEQGNKTFYTTPQMQFKKQTADFKQDLTGKSEDFCSLNPNSQRCKTINKKM
jgi:triacylglycerol esterase/lipase EstA (alpha/beta hydrolase family)